MKPVVLDVETNIPPKWDKSGPQPRTEVYRGYGLVIKKYPKPLTSIKGKYLLIGHNITFDLHVMTNNKFHEIEHGEYSIWDTMVIEYYLRGQDPEFSMISLEKLANVYNLKFKKSTEVTEFFSKGVGAECIDPTLIEPYLEQDLKTTAEIFRAQYKKAQELGMVEFLRDMMDAQLHAIWMESHGLPIDRDEAARFVEEWTEVRDDNEAHCISQMDEWLPGYYGTKGLLANSPYQLLSILKQGATYKTRERVLEGYYKNGREKRKWCYFEKTSPCPQKFDIQDTTANTLSGIYHHPDTLPEIKLFISYVSNYRVALKQLNTYGNYLKKVCDDDTLKTNFIHCITPTGRVTSSNVNIQNLPRKVDDT